MSDSTVESKKTCFIVMPISDVDGYDAGHFKRVYEHIIKPACEATGLVPIRADDVAATNYIAVDILDKILNSDFVICDLSARNPNVMYELGVRHAFDKPVVLIKDARTSRVFDIQGLRTYDYNESLRVDTVARDVAELTKAVRETMAAGTETVNSMIRLLSVQKAAIGKPTHVSDDTALVLNALNDLGRRLTKLEGTSATSRQWVSSTTSDMMIPRAELNRLFTTVISNPPSSGDAPLTTPNGDVVKPGDVIFVGDPPRQRLGKLLTVGDDGTWLLYEAGKNVIPIHPDDPRFGSLTTRPN